MYDYVIRNGFIVDGSGLPAFKGDVAIANGRIAAVGGVKGPARQTLDATGRVVAPGFIDPHTHFDAQLLWDGEARPALAHGVTTVVPGNCSLSLAPLKAVHREALSGMFRQIEELPKESLDGSAFTWTWEHFDGYLDAIRERLSLNVAPLVGHSVIRLWVMGEAAQQRASTPDEQRAMQALLRQCLEAGAVGLSSSYVDVDANLHPVPSRFAHSDELDALAAVLGEYGRVLQVVPEFYNTDITIARVDQLAELSLRHNITTTFSPLFDSANTPQNVPRVMARVREQFARGARVWPQVQTRPIDISFCFDMPSLFFAGNPSWFNFMRMPRDARAAALEDPAQRARLIAAAGADGGSAWLGGLVIRLVPGDNEGIEGRTLGEVAATRGHGCAEAMIELSREHDLKVHFLAANRGHENAERIGPLLADPLVHIGASDGGAHICSFSTYGDTGYLFSKFVRETHALTLEQAVKKITLDTATIWGLRDRGLLHAGYAADVVVFDPETIDRGPERPVHDVPGGGMRYVRDSVGVDAVFVNGALAYDRDGYKSAHSGAVVV
ncbi:MAG: amidohydrolase family protein [Pseudomonadales bacterium]|nr:amidohydrolase family protein [Pseudomonadales bacterium]